MPIWFCRSLLFFFGSVLPLRAWRALRESFLDLRLTELALQVTDRLDPALPDSLGNLLASQSFAIRFRERDAGGRFANRAQEVRLRIVAILEAFAPPGIRFARNHERFESIGATKCI